MSLVLRGTACRSSGSFRACNPHAPGPLALVVGKPRGPVEAKGADPQGARPRRDAGRAWPRLPWPSSPSPSSAPGSPGAPCPIPAQLAIRVPTSTALMEQRRAEAARSGKAYRLDYCGLARPHLAPPRRAPSWPPRTPPSSATPASTGRRSARRRAELDGGRIGRGASTITQQLAKNLWLGTERTYPRKVSEALLAAKLERALSKRRISPST